MPDSYTFPASHYPHRVGEHDGRIDAHKSRDTVADLRRYLTILEPGDRLTFATGGASSGDREAKERPLVVRAVRTYEHRTEWWLEGPEGGRSMIRDSPTFDRPEVWDVYPDDHPSDMTMEGDGELWTLILVGGETGPGI